MLTLENVSTLAALKKWDHMSKKLIDTMQRQRPSTRTRMVNWALKCPMIILIAARSFYNYNIILIIIQHPWTTLTKKSAS